VIPRLFGAAAIRGQSGHGLRPAFIPARTAIRF
jgi:hypothetical protein